MNEWMNEWNKINKHEWTNKLAIQELGKKIKVASRGIATAIVYFGRFYVM